MFAVHGLGSFAYFISSEIQALESFYQVLRLKEKIATLEARKGTNDYVQALIAAATAKKPTEQAAIPEAPDGSSPTPEGVKENPETPEVTDNPTTPA
ncbi:MAG TPA: hypothetical protein VHU83_16315 [Bryobacteraceae bacterium]|nr:hypothetical protein [Bryobacteraceae bacterium]